MANANLAQTVSLAEKVEVSAAIQWFARAKAMRLTVEAL